MKIRLQAKEKYISPKTFLCEICATPVLIGQESTLLIFNYVNKTFPAYFDQDEDMPSYNLIKVCNTCGDNEDV